MTESWAQQVTPGRGTASTFVVVFLVTSTALLAYTYDWFTAPTHHLPADTATVAFPFDQAADQAPTPTQTEALIADLDHSFNAGDLEGYLARFAATHNHRMLAKRLTPVISANQLRRKTQLLNTRSVANRTIAVVSIESWSPGDPAAMRSQETEFLVCIRTGGETRALFAVEVDREELDLLAEQGQQGQFTCLACNYRIQSNDDWLLVPHNRLRAGCLESISFYSLYHDLIIDLSVHIDLAKSSTSPSQVLAKLTAGQLTTTASDWLPPAYGEGRMSPPVGLRGRRVDVSHGDGQISALRLAAYGPIRYLLAVRGPKQTLDEQENAIHAVLASFEVIDPIFSPGHVPAADRPSHLIGALTGKDYVSDLVQFSGPIGWTASRSPGWSQFDITYRCPKGQGYVKVRGMPPPMGLAAWTKEAADLVIAASLAGAKEFVVDDHGWQRGSSRQMNEWADIRSLELTTSGKRRSLIRMAMAPNILVLCEANGESQDLANNVDDVFSSLRHR